MHNSLTSDTFTKVGYHKLELLPKCFHLPKRTLNSLNIVSYFPPHPQTPESTYLLSLGVYILYLVYKNDLMFYVTFMLTFQLLRHEGEQAAAHRLLVPFHCAIMCCCTYTPQIVHALT